MEMKVVKSQDVQECHGCVYKKKKGSLGYAKEKSGVPAGVIERITSWPFYTLLLFLDNEADSGERFCTVVDNNVEQEYEEDIDEEDIIEKRHLQVDFVYETTWRLGRPKEYQKNSRDNIATMLKTACEIMDKFEALGQLISAKLRELKSLDAHAVMEATMKAE
ncbi:unnamed protein product [Cylicocyclus nassatus]|uniref:Uncharacterized protein n=1 Tax=Cylicocyclus nassatus TaxID=53992 RepID=A0AA36DNQ1_CYLNA|nr:unnamed protein product [Cylicocyclus nassatus]